MCAKIFSILAGVLMSVCFVQVNTVSFVTPCKAEDWECITDNVATSIPIFAKGIPELGIDPLDPIILKNLDASKPGLKFIITNGVYSGLSRCLPKKASRDVEKGKVLIEILCDGNLEGDYEMSGQLVKLPVEGKGPLRVIIKKVVHNFEMDLGEKVGKDGKKYWDIKKWDHTYALKDTADFKFGNLFNGNRTLGDPVQETLSTNGKEILQEVGNPIGKVLYDVIFKSVQIFFNNVPVEDLTLDV